MRLRAERKTGELLKALARGERGGDRRSENAKNQTSNDVMFEKSPYAQALQSNNITRQTASRYQALANVSDDVFEEAMRDNQSRTVPPAVIPQGQCAAAGMPAAASLTQLRLVL